MSGVLVQTKIVFALKLKVVLSKKVGRIPVSFSISVGFSNKFLLISPK